MLQGNKLGGNAQALFDGTRSFDILENTKQINTFVGVNNSGKSRFLRTLFSGEKDIKYIYKIEESLLTKIKINLDQIFNRINSLNSNGIVYKYKAEVEKFNQEYQNDNQNSLRTL